MKFVIEFYRVRDADDVYGIVGRETLEAPDLNAAIEIARRLSETLEMPQRPDAVTVSDEAKNKLYSRVFDKLASLDEWLPQ
jgi:hypothetical protein